MGHTVAGWGGSCRGWVILPGNYLELLGEPDSVTTTHLIKTTELQPHTPNYGELLMEHKVNLSTKMEI